MPNPSTRRLLGLSFSASRSTTPTVGPVVAGLARRDTYGFADKRQPATAPGDRVLTVCALGSHRRMLDADALAEGEALGSNGLCNSLVLSSGYETVLQR